MPLKAEPIHAGISSDDNHKAPTMTVSLDFETRSVLDLPQVGAHRYAEHPTTRVLCMSWSVGVGSTQLWWAGQPFPLRLAEAILAGGVVQAWNAAFERIIWPIMVKRHGAPPVDMSKWRCTMVRALLMGYPGKLEHAGPTLGLGKCKDAEGHRVMLQVSKPRKIHRPGDSTYEDALVYAALSGGAALPEYEVYYESDVRCVAQWWVDEGRLSRLGSYCVTDTDVERAAADVLDPLPERELQGWQLDQRMNDRGFQVDMDLVEAARKMVKPAVAVANKKLAALTNGELKSVTKHNEIRAWLNVKLGLEMDSIKKDVLTILLAEMPMDDTVRAVIKLRLAAAKTSVAKLNALVRGTQADGRLRGGLQYAGAGRTNRWAGRRFQPHNIPRPPKWAIQAVPYVQDERIEWLDILFDTPLEVISAILRSCITAGEGNELTVADYNAIEARIVAWLSGAKKMLAAYRNGEDPYRIMAAVVFGINDWRTISKESFERLLGKKIILGCGFGMGHKRFWESCREGDLFIEKDLAKRSVEAYRADNPEVPAAWAELQAAAIQAVRDPGLWVPCLEDKIHFYMDGYYLRMRLPSGRLLSYTAPRLVDTETPWGAPSVDLVFWGWNGQKNRMEWQKLYGGRIMENAGQAIARDVMLDAMLRLDAQGWWLILTVHDEILSDNPKGTKTLTAMIETMVYEEPWHTGLPLEAEGWQGHNYRK